MHSSDPVQSKQSVYSVIWRRPGLHSTLMLTCSLTLGESSHLFVLPFPFFTLFIVFHLLSSEVLPCQGASRQGYTDMLACSLHCWGQGCTSLEPVDKAVSDSIPCHYFRLPCSALHCLLPLFLLLHDQHLLPLPVPVFRDPFRVTGIEETGFHWSAVTYQNDFYSLYCLPANSLTQQLHEICCGIQFNVI